MTPQAKLILAIAEAKRSGLTEFGIMYIAKEECPSTLAILWTNDDFSGCARDYELISEDEEFSESDVESIVSTLDCSHDANIGINWDSISDTISIMLENDEITPVKIVNPPTNEN